MATKKTNKVKKEQKVKTPSIYARIDRLNDYEGSKIKAFASVTIGGAFAVHGIKVVDSDKGLFVSMPYNSFKDSDGNKKYSDVCHAITAEAHKELNDKVIAAYEQTLEEQESEAEDESEDEDQAMTQSM